jgi:cytochrome P450
LQQAQDMLQLWVEKGIQGTTETVGDTATLTLHVFASAGFGIAYPFRKGSSTPPAGYSMTHRDSLLLILDNIIPLYIIPKQYLTLPIFPRGLRKLGQATREFKRYMEEMLDKERAMILKREPGAGNLVSALIRASEDAKQATGGRLSTQGFSDDEIFGNIFIYNLAGYETTANVLAFAIALIAAYPQWQGWVAEELDAVLGDSSDSGNWAYGEAFPRLNRCLAIMVFPIGYGQFFVR